MYYIRRDFWLRRLTAEPVVLDMHGVKLSNGFKAMMVNSNPARRSAAPTPVDVLWLTRGFRGGRLENLPQCYAPRLLVLDASLAGWQREALAMEAARVGWAVYDVAAQGALRLRLEQ